MNLEQAYNQQHDNNFKLLRMLAALAVLVSHSFSIATGNPGSEPLRNWLGTTPGTMAVDVFFITSGFLVTGSLLNRGNLAEFIWARMLRIYPALFVMVAIAVFTLGTAFSDLILSAFLQDELTRSFIFKNLTLVTGVAYKLPHVFVANPYADAVNGSLWTMPYELWAYMGLATFWLASIFAGKRRRNREPRTQPQEQTCAPSFIPPATL